MHAIAAAALLGAAPIGATLSAQDPTPATPAPDQAAPAATKPANPANAAAAAKLQKVLSTTAALPSCAFAVRWGPPQGAGAAGAAGPAAILAQRMNGRGEGVWHGDLLHVALGDDELLSTGRLTLAKDGTRGWSPRHQRFADGNSVTFAPDPQRLLGLLQTMDLAVVHREASSLADRPVEIATIELTQDQYADLLWSGALPESGLESMQMIFGGMIGNRGRAPAAKPQGTVDLALFFDPATNLLQRVHVRTHTKSDGNQIFVGNGGGRVQILGGAVIAGGKNDKDDKDEGEEEPAAAKDAPPTYENGLPVRPKKKMFVNDFELDFSQHGAATAPELDAAAKKLLGR